MNEQIGQQFGSYRLIRLLGRGSFADVYLGEHTYLKTLAAIKILQVRLSEANLEDFLKEARTIAHLEHPNIVRVLDFGVKDRIPFLVMNYAPNGTLRERHPQGSILPLATIVAYVKGIASALQYAHNEKLMHRDVKPENMLLGRNNEILLSDFGIALVTQSTPHQSAPGVIGTVAYMAPEQIQGNPGPASDQYALAVVVYEWLGGYRPFKGGFTELCAQHMHASPSPLRERMPMISSALEAVVMRALAKDPKARYANVQVFATALEQAYQAQTMEESGPTLPATSFPSSPIMAIPPKPSVPQYEDISAYPLRYATFSSNPASDDTVIIDTNKQQAKNSSTIPPTYPILTPPVPAASLADKRDTHDYPFSFKSQDNSRFTRRAFLVGAGLLGVTIVGGSVTWWEISYKGQPKPVSTPTPLPVGTLIYVFRGHPDFVAAIAWSPNSKRIASGSNDRTVQVWDAMNGGHVLTYPGHSDVVSGVTWSPDGKYIATASADLTVQVWNAITGVRLFTYRGHSSPVVCVAWSPDGRYIVSGGYDNVVQVWNATTGQTVSTYRQHSNAIYAVTWSPDSKRIASGSFDHTVQVWNATTARNILIYKGHSAEVRTTAWSPDGKFIVSAGYDDSAQVWDPITGNTILNHNSQIDYVYSVAWSPDSQRIVSGSGNKTVQIWDATTGGHAFTYQGHSGYVFTVAWSSDKQWIASAGSDTTVQVWQAG